MSMCLIYNGEFNLKPHPQVLSQRLSHMPWYIIDSDW